MLICSVQCYEQVFSVLTRHRHLYTTPGLRTAADTRAAADQGSRLRRPPPDCSPRPGRKLGGNGGEEMKMFGLADRASNESSRIFRQNYELCLRYNPFCVLKYLPTDRKELRHKPTYHF